jgi:hypothetical protein
MLLTDNSLIYVNIVLIQPLWRNDFDMLTENKQTGYDEKR